MKPYLVDYITDDNGNIVERTEPEVLRQVCSKAAADTVRSYMQAVVDRGTATHIKAIISLLQEKQELLKKQQKVEEDI